MAVQMRATLTVNGRTFVAQMVIADEAYRQPEIRRGFEAELRAKLAMLLVEEHPPEVSARQVSDPFGRAA
jgi:hypothetical protein